MYNNTMCNSSTTVTQTFSVCYGYASKPDANLEFEWTFSPVGAFAGVDFTPGPDQVEKLHIHYHLGSLVSRQ